DFTTGRWSCQVKEQTPGFDLLLGGDWDHSLGGVLVSDPLHQETGVGRGTGAPTLLTIPSGRRTGGQGSVPDR
ncbi:MAG: hypothetical protein ACK5YE_06005, partial [Planctomyces sp.]